MKLSAAELITERASNTGNNMAVFVIDGTVKATAVTTDLYRSAEKKILHKLAGIYDGDANPSWIVEDVAYCRNLA